MRAFIRGTFVVVAGLSLLAVACSSTVSHDGVAETATTSSTSPKQDVAADTAAAQAAALMLSDFPPGWMSAPSSSSSGPSSLDAQFAKCLGVGQSELSKPAARAVSPNFSNADITVSSTVGYRATSAEQIAAFNLYASPKTPGCLATAVSSLIDDRIRHPPTGSTLPAGVSVGQATVNQMSFPTYGDKSIAYQVKAPITARGLSISLYVDDIVVIKGRADVVMSFQGSPSPVPTDQEQHYTGLVVGRLTNT